jgi:membrane fusion protein (multidrug efflux system)
VAYKAGLGPAAQAMAQSMLGKKDDKKKEVTLEFTPREVAQPQLARLSTRLEFSGPLVAPATAVVRAKASGTLLALNVAEGSRVSAGQALGRIDLAEQTSRLAERSASVESARATLAQAERTHASNERLAAQAFISPIALDNSKAAVDTARAAFNAALASADTTRIGLRDAALVSPIGGIVAKRHVLPGERLSMEQQVLTIIDLARLELAGAVGTHEVSRLSPGMAVLVEVEGVAQPVAGRIARIAPAAEPGTRSIGVTIELPNPKEVLRAGQYAVARVELADDSDRLTLPLAAVGSTSGQDHVWVIEAGQLARRSVKLGRRDEREGRVEVVDGLPATAQVLAARFDNLREGAKAAVVASKAPAVASAAASTPLVK